MTLIRTAQTADIEAMQAVVTDTELFPPEMLPEMMAETEGALWHVAETDGAVVGFSLTREEPLAEGCWNMLALGVASNARRMGTARALVRAVEGELRGKGARVMIVDTSSGPEFDAARMFYEAVAFAQEARIRDYWAAGDDKITFRKRL